MKYWAVCAAIFCGVSLLGMIYLSVESQKEESRFVDNMVRNPGIVFTNGTVDEPSIKIISKNTSGFDMQPPYFVELSKQRCKPITCDCAEWGCVLYCYVCDDTEISGGANNE